MTASVSFCWPSTARLMAVTTTSHHRGRANTAMALNTTTTSMACMAARLSAVAAVATIRAGQRDRPSCSLASRSATMSATTTAAT